MQSSLSFSQAKTNEESQGWIKKNYTIIILTLHATCAIALQCQAYIGSNKTPTIYSVCSSISSFARILCHRSCVSLDTLPSSALGHAQAHSLLHSTIYTGQSQGKELPDSTSQRERPRHQITTRESVSIRAENHGALCTTFRRDSGCLPS